MSIKHLRRVSRRVPRDMPRPLPLPLLVDQTLGLPPCGHVAFIPFFRFTPI